MKYCLKVELNILNYRFFQFLEKSSSTSTSIAVLCITGLIPLGTRKRSPFFGGKNGRSDPASFKYKNTDAVIVLSFNNNYCEFLRNQYKVKF